MNKVYSQCCYALFHLKKYPLGLLLLLIPGLLLVLAGTYYPGELLYKQLMWTRTEALYLKEESENLGGDTGIYDLMEFKDKNGNVHTAKVYDILENDYVEGSDEDHFILYYNPMNPAETIMLNYGMYAIIIFLPFGLFCAYLGWPHKEGAD